MEKNQGREREERDKRTSSAFLSPAVYVHHVGYPDTSFLVLELPFVSRDPSIKMEIESYTETETCLKVQREKELKRVCEELPANLAEMGEKHRTT